MLGFLTKLGKKLMRLVQNSTVSQKLMEDFGTDKRFKTIKTLVFGFIRIFSVALIGIGMALRQ